MAADPDLVLAAPPEPRATARSRPSWRWLGAIPPVLLVLGLELSARLGWVPPHLLPPPSEVLDTLWQLAGQGLGAHLAASSLRVAAGFGAGAAAAIAVGALVGLSRPAGWLLDPSFQALRAIPSLAWVPLLLLWFGIDETPKVL